MEGLKAMHATAMDPEAMHVIAMDPEVNPLDGSLLPLSPPLAYIQKKILPRIVRNPLARSCQRICLEFFLLLPIDIFSFHNFHNHCPERV